ncbi:hypothetical protein OAT10_01840 [Luminiphilus sp.]|nr:hypothetical protein [Luminiphilus sp.]
MKLIGNLFNSVRDRPAYTLMRVPARFSGVRLLVSSARAAVQRRKTARMLQDYDARRTESVFNNIQVEEFLASFAKVGVAEGLQLPNKTLAEIITWAKAEPVYAMRDPARGFWLNDHDAAEDLLGESIILAQYFNSYRNCSAIRQLAEDPILNLIALRHLGSVPKFLGANLWWTFPGEHSEEARRKHAQYFHRDIDDFKFIKFFFYLTDVLPGEGGHWVVKGSHEKHPHIALKDVFLIRRFEDQEISNFYHDDCITEITGRAGKGFAENTLCVHKAGSPERKPRLVLQLQYGLFRYEKPYDEIDPERLEMCTSLHSG